MRVLYRYVWNRVDTVSHVIENRLYVHECHTHTQPGHEPDLMQVKMSRNSPRIDDNLHTVRVETAR